MKNSLIHSSDQTWDAWVILSHKQMLQEQDTRELGKVRAIGNEHLQKTVLNSDPNMGIKFYRREDLVELGADALAPNLRKELESFDKNQAGYDLLSEDRLRIQTKYRGNGLHLENTRRHSEKNKGAASKSGHTAYSLGESDILLLTVPRDPKAPHTNNLADYMLVAIPTSELENPNNPGFLRPSIPKKIFEVFAAKDYRETIKEVNNKVKRERQ